jgi:4-carboxymuconolactone decarboxylase
MNIDNTATNVAHSREASFERGMEALTSIDGAGGQKVIDSLADISPELGHQVVAWALHETATNPTVAYFSTFSRAWELVGRVLS